MSQDTMEGVVTLRDVLLQANTLPEGKLFLPQQEDWSLDTPATLPKLDCYSSEEEIKAFEQSGLQYVLTVGQIRDIVWNARMQLPAASAEQLLRAFKFYWTRDAFITFSGECD